MKTFSVELMTVFPAAGDSKKYTDGHLVIIYLSAMPIHGLVCTV